VEEIASLCRPSFPEGSEGVEGEGEGEGGARPEPIETLVVP